MAAAALTGDQNWTVERNAIYRHRRDLCLASLKNAGLQTDTPKAGLYVWFRVPQPYTSLEFHNLLLEQAHISLTPGHIYGSNGEGWMRISIAAKTENLQKVMERLAQFVRDGV
jgi:aspartate/methionine/tyrosine aminotransferase